MKFLQSLIINCIGFCEYHETSYDNGFFYISQDNHSLLDVLNMFYKMNIAFDYEKVTETVPFIRTREFFKLSNFRRIEEWDSEQMDVKKLVLKISVF